jgi:uncharacterized protein (TIGR02301 family)
MRKSALAALILLTACHLFPARAQDAAAPFDGDLQRLAEILGTLHYLRGICGSNEGAKWRNEMQALIDAETPSGDRRARMIAGFNRGYNGFPQSAAISRKVQKSRATSPRATRTRSVTSGHLILILREPRSGVSKDEGPSGASWFETRVPRSSP